MAAIPVAGMLMLLPSSAVDCAPLANSNFVLAVQPAHSCLHVAPAQLISAQHSHTCEPQSFLRTRLPPAHVTPSDSRFSYAQVPVQLSRSAVLDSSRPAGQPWHNQQLHPHHYQPFLAANGCSSAWATPDHSDLEDEPARKRMRRTSSSSPQPHLLPTCGVGAQRRQQEPTAVVEDLDIEQPAFCFPPGPVSYVHYDVLDTSLPALPANGSTSGLVPACWTQALSVISGNDVTSLYPSAYCPGSTNSVCSSVTLHNGDGSCKGAYAAGPVSHLLGRQTPIAPPRASPQDFIYGCYRLLGFASTTTLELAMHCWRRIDRQCELLRTIYHWTSPAAVGDNCYATACVWLCAKLEEQRKAVPGAQVVSRMMGTTSAVLNALELRILEWLDWSPYRDFKPSQPQHELLTFL